MSLCTLSLASGSGIQGGTITLDLSIASTGGAQVAAVQFALAFGADITAINASALGAVGVAASKAMSAGAGNTYIIFGFNANIIGDGVLATFTFQIAAGAATSNITIGSIVASDASGGSIPTASAPGTVTIAALPTLACPVGGSTAQLLVPYSKTLVGAGAAPLTYSIPAGGLPPGLSLDSTTGVISGIPTALATYVYAPVVTDAYGQTATTSCAIAVGSPAVPNPLPPGLTLDPVTGIISGAPTSGSGSYCYDVKVTDSLGATDTHHCCLALSASPSPCQSLRSLL